MSAVKIKVVVRPNQKKDELWRIDEVIFAKVAAPAVDGKATMHLEKILAKHFGLAPSLVNVVKGQRSNTKIVSIYGPAELVMAAIQILPTHPRQTSLF